LRTRTVLMKYTKKRCFSYANNNIVVITPVARGKFKSS
jgi:hypothetical protein